MEEATKPKTHKLPQVPPDAIFSIQVSGVFLKRAQTLLIAVGEKMGNEKLQKSLQKFKTTNEIPYDIEEATLFMLLALVGEMEREAIAQKKVQEVELTEEQMKQIFKRPGA